MPIVAAYALSPERKTAPVLGAFQARYGLPRWKPRDPMEVLVRGVLSQNTSDSNSAQAYERLMDRFGSWAAVAAAQERQIREAIRVGGLAAQKAGTIRRILAQYGGGAGRSLEHLKGLPARDAERELTSIKGVGTKTARLVLLFAFGTPVFVVDTHVLRVAHRVGLIPPNCTREKAHVLLDALIPDGRKYSAHMNMIRHGRETCHPRAPSCSGCPVRKWCLAFQAGSL